MGRHCKRQMKLNPKPAPKARMITMYEGKYLNLEDMKKAVADDGVVDAALALFKVGQERGDNPRQIMRVALGSLIMDCAGEGKA